MCKASKNNLQNVTRHFHDNQVHLLNSEKNPEFHIVGVGKMYSFFVNRIDLDPLPSGLTDSTGGYWLYFFAEEKLHAF